MRNPVKSFIKCILESDYSSAHKSLQETVNTKIQKRILEEGINQEIKKKWYDEFGREEVDKYYNTFQRLKDEQNSVVKGPEKLFNKWNNKSFLKFKEFVDELDKREKPISKRQQGRSGENIILDNKNYLVVELLSEAAAKKWGKGTVWCISAEHDNAWDSYQEDGNHVFYVVINKKLEEKEKSKIEAQEGMSKHVRLNLPEHQKVDSMYKICFDINRNTEYSVEGVQEKINILYGHDANNDYLDSDTMFTYYEMADGLRVEKREGEEYQKMVDTLIKEGVPKQTFNPPPIIEQAKVMYDKAGSKNTLYLEGPELVTNRESDINYITIPHSLTEQGIKYVNISPRNPTYYSIYFVPYDDQVPALDTISNIHNKFPYGSRIAHFMYTRTETSKKPFSFDIDESFNILKDRIKNSKLFDFSEGVLRYLLVLDNGMQGFYYTNLLKTEYRMFQKEHNQSFEEYMTELRAKYSDPSSTASFPNLREVIGMNGTPLVRDIVYKYTKEYIKNANEDVFDILYGG